MFSKILYLYLMVHACGAEDAFSRLYEAAARRASVCSTERRAHVCAGALWRRDWLLARASCLLPYPYRLSVDVREGVVNCTYDFTAKNEVRTFRKVVSHYIHPSYPDVDLMLLRLNWPWDTDLLDNRTLSDTILDQLDSWIKSINFNKSFMTRKPVHMMRRSYHKMYSSPMRMFLVTVVLPSISFVVFFLFIIFFTGKSKGSNIPYKNLNNGKKETSYV
ncbi:unnamed protein product [Euphydryas editha]|uniref:Uncharacterized protein n=1 Tax=Euphydryas editha TaxID=104508 RepID=A0AAU9VC24_EUPED|nr:unnamed protein product [Euphydryas editha]